MKFISSRIYSYFRFKISATKISFHFSFFLTLLFSGNPLHLSYSIINYIVTLGYSSFHSYKPQWTYLQISILFSVMSKIILNHRRHVQFAYRVIICNFLFNFSSTEMYSEISTCCYMVSNIY